MADRHLRVVDEDLEAGTGPGDAEPAIDDPTFRHWCIGCEHHHAGSQLGFICVGCPCSKRPGETLSGGPKRCPRHCSECPTERGAHHFIEQIGSAEEEPDHAAALAGHAAWYECKHCDGWTVDLEADHG